MLNCSDRQHKFEQLRAHWEAAELDEQRAEMLGRRERQTPHLITHVEAQHNQGSKFRRKLSNGFAFISLSQRKPTPARQIASKASLAISAPSTNDSSTAILHQDVLFSPHTSPTPATTSSDQNALSLVGIQATTISQPLTQSPRSRAFSFIPRPVKTDSEILSVAEKDLPDTPPDVDMNDPKPLPTTKIPTPSPPHSKRRASSPRQYLPFHPPLQTRVVVDRQSLADTADFPLSKAVVRSQTTPNLAKVTSTPQSANHMAPRIQGPKSSFTSSASQQPMLAENTPTSKRAIQRGPQVQDDSVKRESLAVPSAALNRRSFEPTAPPIVQTRHISLAPPVSTKRLSSHFSQMPVAAQCAPAVKPQATARDTGPARLDEDGAVAWPFSSNSKSSLDPTISPVDLTDTPLVLPANLKIERDTQRSTISTSSSLGGRWRSSKGFAAANHQVRKGFSHSSTFQYFGRSETTPVLPIPTQCKPPSSYDLFQSTQHHLRSISFSKRHLQVHMASGQFGPSSRSLLSDIATVQRSAEGASLKSISTSTSTDVPDCAEPEMETHTGKALNQVHDCQETFISVQETKCIASDLKASENPLTRFSAHPVVSLQPRLQHTGRSVSTSRPGMPAGELQTQRHWSIAEFFYPRSADISSYLQVKDYMPPLYWAGRFQSRFDQWRTATMAATLDPQTKPEDENILGQCSLEDEKKAAIFIFMQLRDLCTSTQAADSLHEFEYRYRKDHRLLDTKLDLPPSLCKPEESTLKGPIGRAVRKLTPRKASFVNLFKGKGRNRNDDAKAAGASEPFHDLQDITGLTTSFEAACSDSGESSTGLNVFQLSNRS
ncbi:hypothetical protein SVAN01_00570 [Stagonosporopsis vannaccii]|nr:hypothetical protein SVAN01_00570 [Stagonosporopsis vannaccii]